MLAENKIVRFEILSKNGQFTNEETQQQFLSDQAFYKKDTTRISKIDLVTEKVRPTPGSQSIDWIEIVVGMTGEIIGALLAELLKEYIPKNKKEIKEEKKGSSLLIETPDFKITMHSGDGTLDADGIAKIIESLHK